MAKLEIPRGSGAMRHRIAVQSATTTIDSYGQERTTWDTVGTYWAEVRFKHGRKFSDAGKTKMELTHSIRMRYFGPILSTQRLLFGDRVFSISSINDAGERHREYRIEAQEIVEASST